jgi:hypothetical protein
MPFNSIKIGVSFARFRSRIIFINYIMFFNEAISAQRYQKLLLDTLIKKKLDDVELTNGYFQQDSATTHTTSRRVFPRSPDQRRIVAKPIT